MIFLFFWVSVFSLSSCSLVEKSSSGEGVCCSGKAPLVALFFFVDANGQDVTLGPVRVIGADDEDTFCTLVAPFVSSLYAYALLHPGASDERRVAMFLSGRGFSRLHPACWRFCMMSSCPDTGRELQLEVNYSYRFDDASGWGSVEGVERLTLCGFSGAEPVRYSNDTLPFSVVCIFISDFNGCYI